MHFLVRPEICYESESSVKNGKNNGKSVITTHFHKVPRPLPLTPF